MLLYYKKCRSWKREILVIQPNIYRTLPKVNQVIYTSDTIYMPNIIFLAQAVHKIFSWQGSIGLPCKSWTRGPWATIFTWLNSYKSLIQHFRLSAVMATNQNEEFVQLLYAWWRTTQQTFIKMFCQNTCSDTVIKTYFHFSHYKSMETLATKAHEQRQ